MFKGEISLVSIGNQLFNDGFQRKESVSGRSGVKRLSVKGVKLAFGSRTERTGMIFAVHQGNSSPKSGIGRFEVLSKKFKISSVQTSLKAGNAFQKIQDLRGCAERCLCRTEVFKKNLEIFFLTLGAELLEASQDIFKGIRNLIREKSGYGKNLFKAVFFSL